MEITSHFIGIKVNSTVFRNLFITLQDYITKHNVSQSIELQNNDSLHLSLYYLPEKLTSDERGSSKNTLSSLNQDNKEFMLTAKGYGYFTQQNKERLCYLEPFPTKKLKEWNTLFKEKYKKESILDNQYSYVPHISLYRILNDKIFLKHKAAIEEILTKSLTKVINENIFQGFFLFAVNAKVSPEAYSVVSL